MCDGAAPGTRTGSARDMVFPSAPDRPRTRERARAVSSRREGRTPICAPARRSLARSARARQGTLVACGHDTALLIASLPGSPIVGMGSPVWSIAASTSRSPSLGLASPQDRHPGRSAPGTAAAPRKSASGWHSTRTTVSPESKRPSPGTAWPRRRPGLSRDGTVAGALVPPVDVVAHARGLPVVALAVAARRPAGLPGQSRGQGGADIDKPLVSQNGTSTPFRDRTGRSSWYG